MRCPNPIYSSHPNSRLVKCRRVPTAAEQCGCTILRELARRVANSSHSVAPSAHNSALRSSNMKTSPQRAERRRGWPVGYGPRRRSQFGAKLFCGCRQKTTFPPNWSRHCRFRRSDRFGPSAGPHRQSRTNTWHKPGGCNSAGGFDA